MDERKRIIRGLSELSLLTYSDIAFLWGIKVETVRNYLSYSFPQGPTDEQEEIIRLHYKRFMEKRKGNGNDEQSP